jgi:hypothetical protein
MVASGKHRHTLFQKIPIDKNVFSVIKQTLLATVVCLIAVSAGAMTVGKAAAPKGVYVISIQPPLVSSPWRSFYTYLSLCL